MRLCIFLLIIICLPLHLAATAAAQTQEIEDTNNVQETKNNPKEISDQRTHALFNEVRCPVCNGQSVAESDVLVSVSIRDYIVSRIAAGDSDDEIKKSLVERFGQGILFEPELAPNTFLLWITPWACIALLILFFRRHTKTTPRESK